MADTTSQRVLRLARAGFSPSDIAQFMQTTEAAVLASLADLTIDGASQSQRILSLVLAGHHPDAVSEWLAVDRPVVFAALQDLTQNTTSQVAMLGGAVNPVPPYST